MRILAVSDLRVQSIRMVERVAQRLAPDLILYAGDDVLRFGPGANSWSPLARRTRFGLAGVLGNDCLLADAVAFDQPGCRDLHKRPLLLDGLAILGLQGAPGDECDPIGATLYTRARARAHIKEQLAHAGARNLLLVSHTPPRGLLDTAIRFGVRGVGSSVVRSFADLTRARGVVCGHVHLQGGRSESVGECLVVNVASHDHVGAPLRYGVLEWDGKRLRILELGIERDRGGFSGVIRTGTMRAARLARAGFRSLSDVLGAEDAALAQIFSKPESARRFRARARAAYTGSPVVIDPTFQLADGTVIVDVETSLLQNDPWLVGYKRWGGSRVHQLQELEPRRHPKHLRIVGQTLRHLDAAQFLQWGPFDRGALHRAHEALGIAPGRWLEGGRWMNAGALIERIVALPVSDYSLKTVGRHLGYVFASELTGLQVGLWYQRYRDDGTPFDIRKVRAYNRDDVLAVEHVLRWVAELVSGGAAFVEPPFTARHRRERKRVSRGWTDDSMARAVERYAAALEPRVARGQMTRFDRARAIAAYKAAIRRRRTVSSGESGDMH